MRMHAATMSALVVLLSAASLVGAASKTAIAIEPGPLTQTPEELALAADPASGVEHGVVIVHDVERNDERMGSRYSVHFRAKVLSNEGRALGDIAIPVHPEGKLEKWWGRTILPDGAVHELPEDELETQKLDELQGRGTSLIKGALPAVAPGAVIDYGYVLQDSVMPWFDQVPVQQPWPVRSFRYRWIVGPVFGAAYLPKHMDPIDADFQKADRTILIEARGVPAFQSEPYAPPADEISAGVTLYYIDPSSTYKDFWNDLCKVQEKAFRTYVAKERLLEKVVAAWSLPADAPLAKRIRHAYDWVGANVRAVGFMSVEELEEREESTAAEMDRPSLARLLDRGEGSWLEVAFLFAGLVRTLGGEANLVNAVDRSRHYWDPNLKSALAFDTMLVAVRLPGQPDDAWTFVDPGTGLGWAELAWWNTGVQGLMATAEGGKPVKIPFAQPKDNAWETQVQLSFAEDLETLSAKWSATGKGQVGYDERRVLRQLEPDERSAEIDERCGADGTTEVLAAAAPGLEELVGHYRLECETERGGLSLSEDLGSYSVEFGGPWLGPLPDLGAAPSRTHPLVFPFARVDATMLEVTAPPGFAPDATPITPVRLESPFGRYTLHVKHTAAAFHVERMFAFTGVLVPPTSYADLKRFLDDVRRHDQTPLLFRRGT